ncbi:MAG TPA: tetratricopeptide repeat protein [Methylomirabilota bacterium]|nr:tetratricopeptide repeat protein [Methylomirabilota bacterium]
MSLRLALLLVLLFGVLIAYLTSLNASGVRVALGRDWTFDLPLMALVIGAFLVGAALALVLGTLRDLGRTYHAYQVARRARRDDTVNEIYQRGVEAQLSGNTAEAAHAYEQVLRRDPGHRQAPIRLGELARLRGDAQAALGHHLQALRAEERPETLVALADDYRRLGRADEAVEAYRRVLARERDHVMALRGLRDVAADRGRWAEALSSQERLTRLAPREERAAEETWLAAIHYELGRALLAEGNTQAAIGCFKDALRARSDFLPAMLLLGDAHLKAGDAREALRVWERGLETQPAAPLLSRIEHLYRAEGRPARMISLYQETAARHRDNLAVAFGLGRVYFELAMLDEAAEQFEKMEVQAPDLPAIHAYLGAVFERHGQIREAFDEYRRALRFPEAFEWPHRCGACGVTQSSWFDRCPSCRRWNSSRP